eukprot:scaffold171563_cov31-Tisochrysis_lutea.AAC.4
MCSATLACDHDGRTGDTESKRCARRAAERTLASPWEMQDSACQRAVDTHDVLRRSGRTS